MKILLALPLIYGAALNHLQKVSQYGEMLSQKMILPLEDYLFINEKLPKFIASIYPLSSGAGDLFYELGTCFLPANFHRLPQVYKAIVEKTEDTDKVAMLEKAIPLAELEIIKRTIQKGTPAGHVTVADGLNRISKAQSVILAYHKLKEKDYEASQSLLLHAYDGPYEEQLLPSIMNAFTEKPPVHNNVHMWCVLKLDTVFQNFPWMAGCPIRRFLESLKSLMVRRSNYQNTEKDKYVIDCLKEDIEILRNLNTDAKAFVNGLALILEGFITSDTQ